MILAKVVLPEPDSPTMPSVSPALTFTLTPSSALTNPLEPIAKPLLTGKYFFRPSASIIGIAYGRPGPSTGLVAQHSARWPLPTETVGGDCSRQIACRSGQRGAKGHPPGSRDRSGGWPPISTSFWCPRPTSGRQRGSERV